MLFEPVLPVQRRRMVAQCFLNKGASDRVILLWSGWSQAHSLELSLVLGVERPIHLRHFCQIPSASMGQWAL